MGGPRSLFKTATITIATSTTISDAINCEGMDVVAVQLPTMTGTAITFQGSADGTTFVAIHDDAGAAVSLTTASDRYVSIGTVTKALKGMRFLKVVSGSAEAANRSIKVVLAAR